MKCSAKDFKRLSKLNRYSGDVWNICLDLEKSYREENEGRWITRGDLQKLTKGCVPLHAKGIHHIVHKYIFARDAALKALKGDGTNNKFPHKRKRYFTTGWDSQSIKVNKNKVVLSVPMIKNKDGKKKKDKPIVIYMKKPMDNIVQVELLYKNGYRISVKYYEMVSFYKITEDNAAAIDLGEIHTITSIDKQGASIIITGRKIRSIKQERNKHQANIYRRMSKCTRNSRQYKKYRCALTTLKYKYDEKILDCVHKITKMYVDYCIENNIKTIYYGNLDSATRGTKGHTGKFVRQKLNQWNYGEVMKHLENKLSRYGVELIKVSEYYTSQKCLNCKELNKPKGRHYKCKECEYEQHRDIVGAINILNDNAGTNLTRYKSYKYLRID